MTSLSRVLAGRKRDSSVWDYFEYDRATDKSLCIVVDGSQKRCNVKLSGKNSSNLVAHLRRCHEAAHDAYTDKEKEKRSEKCGVKRRRTDDNTKVQTITECYNRRIVIWGTTSPEYVQRRRSVMDMIVATGYPSSMLDQPSFRMMMTTLDPKFKPPG
jgi:hypothetical protein